jgi:hypothetical protein
MMKVLLSIIMIVLFTASVEAQTGIYTVSGINPDGRTYAGVAEIVEQQGLLILAWEQTAGDTAEGYAYLDGDILVFIGRALSPDKTQQAFVFGHYVKTDGKWVGKWSSPGQPTPGSETLTPSTKTLEQLRKLLQGPKTQA